MGDWSTPQDLVHQVQRLWERGDVLRAALSGEALFPKVLRVRRPSAGEIGARFGEVREWVRELEDGSRKHGYVLELEEVRHRQLGLNQLPARVVIHTDADALRMIGKVRAAERFHEMRAQTVSEFPALAAWVSKRPMKMLEMEEAWSRVLAVLRWFRDRPSLGLYRRQLEIEGVDTKFIENNRLLLAELLDVLLPPDRIVTERGASFDRRYGLREKPSLVRFRILDPSRYVQGLSDISVPAEELARLPVTGDDIIVTENEVNGLALLPRANTLAIFGQGYALERLGDIPWLRSRRLHYWSDIDTHGFAMLDRFRAHFPEAKSLMMDRETLLAHRPLWVTEPEPSTESFTRLTPSEHELVRELRRGTFGERLRLEQERISFTWVRTALARL